MSVFFFAMQGKSQTVSWKILPMTKPGCSRSTAMSPQDLTDILTKWWLSDDEMGSPSGKSTKGEDDDERTTDHILMSIPRPSLKWVGFVDSGLRMPGQMLDNFSMIGPRGTELSMEKIYLVFYAVVPNGYQNELHVLGGIPRRDLQGKEDLYIKDLLQTKRVCLDNYIPYQGTQSKNFWFYIPVDPKPKDGMFCGMDNIRYRLDLVMKWWEHRNTPDFEMDGWNMLRFLHGERLDDDDDVGSNHFFDLETEEGRQRDLTTFFCVMFFCSNQPALWERWMHWERSLFQFRMRRYFLTEDHVMLLMEKNDMLSRFTGIKLYEDPGERERELYKARWPGDPYPKIWFGVPIAHTGRRISESPLYDLENGRVILTHQDFSDWSWSHVEIYAKEFMRTIYNKKLPRSHPRQSVKTRMMDLFMYDVQTTLRDEMGIAAQKRQRIRAQMMETGDLKMFDVTKAESLLELAKKAFPPCMAIHIWRAIVHGKHPKHAARFALSMFLIEAEYAVEEVEHIISMLYEADTAFVNTRYPRTGWTPDAFKREYGGQVELLHANMRVNNKVSAFKCESLTNEEKRNTECGCPFAATGSSEITGFLEWAGTGDIENIMKRGHPQERCLFYYQDRHPDREGIVVRHPNQFLRGKCVIVNQSSQKLVTGGESMQKRIKV